LVFNNYSLYYPFPFGAGVVNAHFLPSSQRRSHDFACAIDDSRGRAQSKTDWALLTLDYNSSTGLIRGHGLPCTLCSLSVLSLLVPLLFRLLLCSSAQMPQAQLMRRRERLLFLSYMPPLFVLMFSLERHARKLDRHPCIRLSISPSDGCWPPLFERHRFFQSETTMWSTRRV